MKLGTGLVIQETAPDLSITGIYYTYVWLKPSTQQFFTMDGAGGWIEAADFPEGVTPETLASAISALLSSDVNFSGNVTISGNLYAEDKKGENATVVIPGVGTLKFKHGIMHEFKTP